MGRAGVSILIMDGDRVSRDYAARAAENAGYIATVVGDAGDALEALGADPSVKVFVASNDWTNGIDGAALSRTVRCFWPSLAIVLTCDGAFPNDADLPADTILLTKPFAPRQLMDALNDALKARSLSCDDAQPTVGVEGPRRRKAEALRKPEHQPGMLWDAFRR